VEYEYDADDRLRKVRYPSGQSTTYAYDTSNRVVSAEDSLGGIFLTVEYDANQRSVARVSMEGRAYGFQYVRDEAPNLDHVDILDPGGELTRVKLWGVDRGFHYSVEKLGRASTYPRVAAKE
jgi:YD repeat-containing protein